MLSRIITASQEMTDFQFGRDDELDAALILSGTVEHQPKGRYCFQTTYLNECFRDYYETANTDKLIWVVRNPLSVVRSMIHNWGRFAFNELFQYCGYTELTEKQKLRYEKWGLWSISPLSRACCSYNAKNRQLFELMDNLGQDRVLVVDYDDLVKFPDSILPVIYQFIELPYRRESAAMIHRKSLHKSNRLSSRSQAAIDIACSPVYSETLNFLPYDKERF